jgi:serine/threonine protein kinase
LHGLKVIHSDIKPDNIFVHDMISEKLENYHEKDIIDNCFLFKLGDLGISSITEALMEGVRKGTPLFFAPEIFLRNEIDFPVDIWAFAVSIL